MITKPTQFELASLAAQVTGKGSPEHKVGVAMDLWGAAGLALQPEPVDPDYNCTQDFKLFLRDTLSTIRTVAQRRQRYAEFLYATNHEKLKRQFHSSPKILRGASGAPRPQVMKDVDKEARGMTDRMLNDQTLHGVPYSSQTAEEFRSWNELQADGKKRSKAGQGGKARASKRKRGL